MTNQEEVEVWCNKQHLARISDRYRDDGLYQCELQRADAKEKVRSGDNWFRASLARQGTRRVKFTTRTPKEVESDGENLDIETEDTTFRVIE